MLKSLKIFLIILGLGIFIIPKQMLYAKAPTEKCCNKSGQQKDCCQEEEKSSCHSGKSDSKSSKKDCGNSCANCHTCSVNVVMTYLPHQPIITLLLFHVSKTEVSTYQPPFFTSRFQNIWQPPKLV